MFLLYRYTTDILASAVYGLDNCNSLKKPNRQFRRYGIKAVDFGRIKGLIAAFIPEILEALNLPFYHKEMNDYFSKVFNETIECRRTDTDRRKDFMNFLIQLADRGIVEDETKPFVHSDKFTGIIDQKKVSFEIFNGNASIWEKLVIL